MSDLTMNDLMTKLESQSNELNELKKVQHEKNLLSIVAI